MSNEVFTINFEKNKIDSDAFESNLLFSIEKNLKTQNKYSKVIIDLRNIVWIDLLELLCLPVVSEYLKSLGKEVEFIFSLPKRSEDKRNDQIIKFYYTLKEWDLMKYIDYRTESEGIEFKSLKSEYIETWDYFYNPKKKDDRKIIPLVSVKTEKEFAYTHNFIRSELEHFFRRTMGEVTQDVDDFIGTIVYEICENIHIHSNAKIGLVSLRYLSPEFLPRRDSKYEQFFKKYLDTPFFELSIVDSGIGIYHSLGPKLFGENAYKSEDELSILKRAFQRHFRKDGKGESRGLFDVKNAIEKWNGYLLLRSGRSRLELTDFTASSNNPYLPGTQYLIFFPATFVRRKKYESLLIQKDLFDDKLDKLQEKDYDLKYLNLSKIKMEVEDRRGKDLENSQEERFRLELQNKLNNLNDNEILTIDCGDEVEIKTGFFERTLMELVQHDEFCNKVIFVNLTHQMIDSFLRADRLMKELEEKKRFILVFDEMDRPFAVMTDNNLKKALDALLQNKSVKRKILRDTYKITKKSTQEMLEELIERNTFTAKGTKEGNTIYSCYDFNKIFEKFLQEQFEIELRKTNAYHQDENIHYKLFSGKHTEIYIEPRLLFQSRAFVDRIARRINQLFSNKEINVLYSSSITGIVLSSIIMERMKTVDRYVIAKDYSDEAPFYKEGEIKNGEKVLIITDVIDTGGLIEKIIRRVKDAKGDIIGVVAIVDTAEQEISEIEGIKLTTLFTKRIKKYEPTRCELCKKKVPVRIDHFTLTPEIIYSRYEERFKKLEEDEIIDLYYKSEKFSEEKEFWDMINYSNALKLGHFIKDDNHFTSYIETAKILSKKDNIELIKPKIKEITKEIENKMRKIDVIIHPPNYSSTILSMLFADTFRERFNIDVISSVRKSKTEYDILPANLDQIKGKNVLFVDDGANKGKTFLSMKELIHRYKGKKLSIYVMVSRLEHATYEAFKDLISKNFYCHYLLNLPVYDAVTCPICQEIECLQQRLFEAKSRSLKEFISCKINKLEPTFLPKEY